jgi:hypothetical protein
MVMEGQTVIFTHLISPEKQTRRETFVRKVYKNGNFKIHGSNTTFSLESCGRLARASGKAVESTSRYIVIEIVK